MKFTGERVVPKAMLQWENSIDAYNKIYTCLEHLRRYIFAKKYCKGKSVLDAACGCGYGTAILGEVSEGALGVDINWDTITYARDNYNKYTKIIFDQVNLENGISEYCFESDVIVSFETIEHLKNPHKFLKDVSEICDTFIFSLPLNNKSKFHKQVYSLKEAKQLINKYFRKWHIDLYEQNLTEIKPLTNEGRFLIGVAQKNGILYETK